MSVLLVVSRIYERIMQPQILEYINKHISPTYADIYWKTLDTNKFNIHAWKCKLPIENNGLAGGILMDVSR